MSKDKAKEAEPVTIELGEEPAAPEEELAPLPEPKTYKIVSGRSFTINGHSIDPGEMGTITLNYGISPGWAVSMFGRGLRAVDE